jgi:hypothetical protein
MHTNLKAEDVLSSRPFNNSDRRKWRNQTRKSRCRPDFGDYWELSAESPNVNLSDCCSSPSWPPRKSLGLISGQRLCRAFRNRSAETKAIRQLTWCAFLMCGAVNVD